MIDKKTVRNLYYQTLRIRLIEEAIADEYKYQQMRCPTHLYIGQEAIAAGVAENLIKEDIVYSTHRSHGHYLAKRGSVERMIAELYGKETGCTGGIGGSQHLIDLSVNYYGAVPIVGETIPLAVGAALAIKMKKENRISVVFLGDAATEEGIFAESINFAVLKKLSILFICENNLYSTYTHIRERQPKRPIFGIAKAYGAMSYQEDGNDVVKVFELSRKVVRNIRKGQGPAFIEFLTYRLREHVGPNYDLTGYRPTEELKRWQEKSPIERIRKYVRSRKIMDEEGMERMGRKIKKEIDEAFRFAKESPYPKGGLSESQVFA